MLNTPLVHPDILRILAQAGHHSKVLIADGNYPAANKRGPRAELVSLQLSPGVPTVAQVFEADGSAAKDYIFERGCLGGRALHLRNAPSPACTASLAIAETVIDIAAQDFGWPKPVRP
jgi:L-fucose mutarotase/ribose pyranase (RbsD/FucU family)